MLFAVSANQVFEYVCERERDVENPTVFVLRSLTARELGGIEDKVTQLNQGKDGENVTVSIFTGTQSLMALRAGLRGWKNFMVDADTPAQFQTNKAGVPTDETLDLIPAEVRQELANEILAKTRIKEDDAKN
jgi:hypothetical protein